MRERNQQPGFQLNVNVFQPFQKQFDIRSLKKQLWKQMEQPVDVEHQEQEWLMSDIMGDIY